ncbi:preprotein translocase subunit YajC [Pseudonocardia ammonioxydans]|uniref:Preprotein translocase subunit YajC n=1 Tax=Pseudonocardia ammonioxydans TaxID=260086 RepID=A0A1I5ADM7_PSUAM|nr:preprotein translocase subunit YajC [Pseudonocardia ammonioxydans]SFN60585.1 preprotein translocase subunit YajC [Pseudonocardia ammonioxydans]
MDLILAQEAGGSGLLSLLPFLIILLLFVPLFLNGRKQRKQMQETQAMQQALEDGDVVVTTSGLRGTIVDASYEDTIDLEIAEGVVTTWLRAAIREKVNADEAAEETTEAEPESESKSESENKPTIH